MSQPTGTRHEVGDDRVRLVLSERWGPGPMLGWMGMNPSFASKDRTDPTWTRGGQLSRLWGFGGQMWVNPVPMRASDPDAALAVLRAIANGKDDWAAAQMEVNRSHLEQVGGYPAAWVIGWGDKGAAMNNVLRCHRKALDALYIGGARTFLSLGLTASGNPKHLLARGKSRVGDDARLYEWRANWRARGPSIAPAEIIAAHREPMLPKILGPAA